MADPRETLARIRRRADAATEGPWQKNQYEPYPGHDRGDVSICGRQGNVTVAYWYYDDKYETADAEFIAHARTDVPWLLEQVDLRDKALEAVLALHQDGGESQGYLDDGSYGDMPHCCTECGSLGEYGVPWPCPTVEAITTALNGDAA